MKLTIELVPSSSWYNNVRSNVSKEEWDRLRKQCYKDAGYRCEVCGGKGNKHPVECHEIWHYDDSTKTQTLEGLIALCPSCHEVKHIGLAQVKGNLDRAMRHLMDVNDITLSEAEQYLDECFLRWEARSLSEWEVDISWLDS